MVRALKRTLTVVALTACAVAVFAGVSSATTSSARHVDAAVRAASCPPGGPTAIEHLSSTRASGKLLAPKGTLWTTVCGLNDHGVLKGGPMNAALNTAGKPKPLPPNRPCPQWVEAPILVILQYSTGTRQFVLQFSGCSDVVKLHDGAELSFTANGLKQVEAVLNRARQS
jgi:hypothetical protein